MIFKLLCLFFVVFSQEFEATMEYRKFDACRELVKLKLSEGREELETFYAKFPNAVEVDSIVSIDMLSKCFRTISLDTAETVLQQENDLVLIGDFNELVELNLEMYEEKDVVFSSKHKEFHESIDKLREQAELEADDFEKKRRSAKPLFTAGPFYILAVGVFFAGIFYWALSKLNHKKPKKVKNKKKNN